MSYRAVVTCANMRHDFVIAITIIFSYFQQWPQKPLVKRFPTTSIVCLAPVSLVQRLRLLLECTRGSRMDLWSRDKANICHNPLVAVWRVAQCCSLQTNIFARSKMHRLFNRLLMIKIHSMYFGQCYMMTNWQIYIYICTYIYIYTPSILRYKHELYLSRV